MIGTQKMIFFHVWAAVAVFAASFQENGAEKPKARSFLRILVWCTAMEYFCLWPAVDPLDFLYLNLVDWTRDTHWTPPWICQLDANKYFIHTHTNKMWIGVAFRLVNQMQFQMQWFVLALSSADFKIDNKLGIYVVQRNNEQLVLAIFFLNFLPLWLSRNLIIIIFLSFLTRYKNS